MAVDGNGRHELRQLVKLDFGPPPLVVLLPDVNEPFDVIKWRAVFPVIREKSSRREMLRERASF